MSIYNYNHSLTHNRSYLKNGANVTLCGHRRVKKLNSPRGGFQRSPWLVFSRRATNEQQYADERA